MVPKRPNRHLRIFLGHCYTCNKFGHKSLNCRAYGKVPEYKKKSSSNKPKGNHNIFTIIQKYGSVTNVMTMDIWQEIVNY